MGNDAKLFISNLYRFYQPERLVESVQEERSDWNFAPLDEQKCEADALKDMILI